MIRLIFIDISMCILHCNMGLDDITYKEDYYTLIPNHILQRETEKMWHVYILNTARLCLHRNIYSPVHKITLIPAYRINIRNHVGTHYISYLFYLYKCIQEIGLNPTGPKKIHSCYYIKYKCEHFRCKKLRQGEIRNTEQFFIHLEGKSPPYKNAIFKFLVLVYLTYMG